MLHTKKKKSLYVWGSFELSVGKEKEKNPNGASVSVQICKAIHLLQNILTPFDIVSFVKYGYLNTDETERALQH